MFIKIERFNSISEFSNQRRIYLSTTKKIRKAVRILEFIYFSKSHWGFPPLPLIPEPIHIGHSSHTTLLSLSPFISCHSTILCRAQTRIEHPANIYSRPGTILYGTRWQYSVQDAPYLSAQRLSSLQARSSSRRVRYTG